MNVNFNYPLPARTTIAPDSVTINLSIEDAVRLYAILGRAPSGSTNGMYSQLKAALGTAVRPSSILVNRDYGNFRTDDHMWMDEDSVRGVARIVQSANAVDA